MKLLSRSLTLALIGGLLAASGRADAALVVDQEHTGNPFNSVYRALHEGNTWAQTFTVGQDGLLARFEVLAVRSANTTEDLRVGLWSTDVDGRPAAPILEWSTPPSAVDSLTGIDIGFLGFDLGASAFAVAAGQVYAIVLATYALNVPPLHDERYAWGYRAGYDRGLPYISYDGSNFFATSDSFYFRTFVQVENGGGNGVIPEPASMILAGSGLGLLAVARRRLARP